MHGRKRIQHKNPLGGVSCVVRSGVAKLKFQRIANRWRVLRNQAEIIRRIRIERAPVRLRPVPPSGCGGSVEHYYHFLFDLLLPLDCLVRQAPSGTLFLLEDVGPFSDRLRATFPDSVAILEDSDVAPVFRTVDLIGMNPRCVPVSRIALENLKKTVSCRLQIDTAAPRRNVLLIERAPPSAFYLSNSKVRGGGSDRRSIVNHDHLRDALGQTFRAPKRFTNLKLEHVPFEDQVQAFDGATIVVAQHGASLANCAWLRPGATVVELSHDSSLDHFSRLAHIVRAQHLRYVTSGPHAEIDVSHFLAWLERNLCPHRCAE